MNIAVAFFAGWAGIFLFALSWIIAKGLLWTIAIALKLGLIIAAIYLPFALVRRAIKGK